MSDVFELESEIELESDEVIMENETVEEIVETPMPFSMTTNNGVERGKFRSLTLINWNGFFARTFDLDELVTTLSGGNGAGKSTTMAGFVTALIPDLTPEERQYEDEGIGFLCDLNLVLNNQKLERE